MVTARHKAVRQQGFTYLAVLFAVALSAVAMSATLALWSTEEQRDRERELLFVGSQFRMAIISYYQASPDQNPQYPPDLQALLEDHRFTPARRHLRRLYADPVTRSTNWGLVRTPNGRVMGVHSLSMEAPLKRANFSDEDRLFTGKTHYADWAFVYELGNDINLPAVFLPQP